MKPFKIGIDSYSLKPLGLSPFELLDWAIMNEADGVQFSGGDTDPGHILDKAFLADLAGYAVENRLYLEWGGGEYLPLDPATGKPRDILAVNRKAAEQACLLGASVLRSASGGVTRRNKKFPLAEDLLRLIAKSMREQKQMLQDVGVTLALETQFLLTSSELIRLFEMCGARPGEQFGICLDTMNLLVMLEEPAAATERLLPWVVSTHIKDGAVLLSEEGFLVFPTEAGRGIVNFSSIFETLSRSERKINLSLEDHGGEFTVPLFDLEFLDRFPDLKAAGLAGLMKLSLKSQNLLDEGHIAILDRQDWPEHCERRIKRGLRAVRGIVDSASK